MVCSVGVNVGLVFVNNSIVYTVLRLLAGAFAHGGVVVGYVYLMEFVGPKSRSWAGAHYLSAFSIGFGSLSLIGYYARDWHDMQIWIAVSCAPFFILYFLCPVSHRWLYAKGKIDEARSELKKFGDRCGADLRNFHQF